jgi:hypothetical protein
MENQDARELVIWIVPIALPVFFILLWLLITTILALASGWFRLAKVFPDREEAALVEFRGMSGAMGPGVNMRNVLRFGVCRSGLRIGILRLLGPFSKDFLVPWSSIGVSREKVLFGTAARLRFGNPVVGSIVIPAGDADRLAEAAVGNWPERGSAVR